MPKPKHKIAFYFSDTGGGHRSAVDAIQTAVTEVAREAGITSHIELYIDGLVEKTHPINKSFVMLYNYLLRHHQPLMKYYYWFLHFTKPNESNYGYSLVSKYLQDEFLKSRPEVVVSVHPMTNHYLTRALTDCGLRDKTKFITIITDPNTDLWRGWACEDADIIIAPNDLVKEKLVSWGMTPEKIKIIGMPVHPDFLRAPKIERERFLSLLGLSPDIFTVCINAGWAGGGNMLKIYDWLASTKKPVQCVFLCGHNNKLYEAACELASKSPVPTTVLPFHDSMSDLMNACDLMITKAGGLTSFQCLARRVPIAFDITTEPMPQEKGTIDILAGQKVAYTVSKQSDIVDLLNSLSIITNRNQRQLPDKHSLNCTDAVYQMAYTILECCSGIEIPTTANKETVS
jgi:UDP-N-acetylglucosamine:LPS N-acetylglucosamine transferase